MIPGLCAIPPTAPGAYSAGGGATAFESVAITNSLLSGYINYSLRQVLTPLAVGGRQFRFTFRASMEVTRIGFQAQAAQGGGQGGFGDDSSKEYFTVGTPVEIPGIPGTAAYPATILTDWFELPQVVSTSDKLVVVMDIPGAPNGAGQKDFRYGTVSNCRMWYRQSVLTWNLATPPDTWNVQDNFVGIVTKVEAR
jgi:hypothetical protein